MRHAIVRQLIVKDLRLMKGPALGYLLAGVAALLFTMLVGSSGWVYWLTGQILFISALFGAGVHAAMVTIMEERRDKHLAFIMSLPVTILDYTKAKILANLALSGGVWLMLSAAGYIVFARDFLAIGAVPFITVFFVLVLVAFIVILSACLIFESQAAAIVSTVGSNLLGTLFMWWFVDLYGVRSTVNGDAIVWNRTYLTTLGLELAAIAGLIGLTLYVQSRKTEFV